MIQKLIIDLHFVKDIENTELQEFINDFVKKRFLTELESVFENFDIPEDLHIVIPKIEIDLGQFDFTQLNALLSNFNDKLSESINEVLNKKSNTTKIEYLDQTVSKLKAIEYFLEKGFFPWWYRSEKSTNFNDLVENILDQRLLKLTKILKKEGVNVTLKRVQRFVLQSEIKQSYRLIDLIIKNIKQPDRSMIKQSFDRLVGTPLEITLRNIHQISDKKLLIELLHFLLISDDNLKWNKIENKLAVISNKKDNKKLNKKKYKININNNLEYEVKTKNDGKKSRIVNSEIEKEFKISPFHEPREIKSNAFAKREFSLDLFPFSFLRDIFIFFLFFNEFPVWSNEFIDRLKKSIRKYRKFEVFEKIVLYLYDNYRKEFLELLQKLMKERWLLVIISQYYPLFLIRLLLSFLYGTKYQQVLILQQRLILLFENRIATKVGIEQFVIVLLFIHNEQVVVGLSEKKIDDLAADLFYLETENFVETEHKTEEELLYSIFSDYFYDKQISEISLPDFIARIAKLSEESLLKMLKQPKAYAIFKYRFPEKLRLAILRKLYKDQYSKLNSVFLEFQYFIASTSLKNMPLERLMQEMHAETLRLFLTQKSVSAKQLSDTKLKKTFQVFLEQKYGSTDELTEYEVKEAVRLFLEQENSLHKQVDAIFDSFKKYIPTESTVHQLEDIIIEKTKEKHTRIPIISTTIEQTRLFKKKQNTAFVKNIQLFILQITSSWEQLKQKVGIKRQIEIEKINKNTDVIAFQLLFYLKSGIMHWSSPFVSNSELGEAFMKKKDSIIKKYKEIFIVIFKEKYTKERLSISFSAELSQYLEQKIGDESQEEIKKVIEQEKDENLKEIKFTLKGEEDFYSKLLKEKIDWVDQEQTRDNIHINNAGLILLWTFLPFLFTRLGLVKKEDKKNIFINEAAQEHAVHLTQYLVTGKENHEESDLILNKLLCGYDLTQPISKELAISDHDKKECDMLINSAINHWTILGKTSISGLRESFLKREGSIAFKDANASLKVEQKAIDVLLDKLPWSFQTIKFSWNDYMIFVDWNA